MRCEGCDKKFELGERYYEAACQYTYCLDCVETAVAVPVPA